METLPIPRTTLADMVNAYVLSEQEIRQAYGLLVNARTRLKTVYGDTGYGFHLQGDGSYHGGRPDYTKPDETMKGVKKDVWRILVGRMELRRILSTARSAELDKQIETGDGLPEITMDGLLGMLEGTLANAPTFLEESVREVYDFLRPHSDKYKTNSRYEIGPKVILGWMLSHGYGKNPFQPNYHHRQRMTALDNVFHALDGKGSIAHSYQGPLADAICASEDGKGETDYFRFKCYGNLNLHLEFKRLDLLAKLNQIAGGAHLKNSTPDYAAA